MAVTYQAIPLKDAKDYMCSYVALENITRMYEKEGDRENFYLELWIPGLYEKLVTKLKDNFMTASIDSAIRHSPILQGYVFEGKFLSTPRLNDLSVTVIAQSQDATTFTFDVTPANFQLSQPLAQLLPGQIHHLRVEHPAIDAVCYATERSSKEWFLLLIQVSLRSYEDHASKGIDLHKCVVGAEKKFAGAVSVANYYSNQLTTTITDDHVAYIYASPKALQQPHKTDFTQELRMDP